jgi:high-affinity iron transporter
MNTLLLAGSSEFAYAFFLFFREGFESFLILFLVLGFIEKSGNISLKKTVYSGALAAIGASISLALLFYFIKIEFKGNTEKVFEGITMMVTSILLAVMILWLVKFKVNTQAIRSEVQAFAGNNNRLGLALLIFFSIFREGVETVLFLLVRPEGQDSLLGYFSGSFVGLIVAFALCYSIFKGLIKLNFSLFFNITTGLLLFMAAGLMAHGVNELVQANWINPIIQPIWDINPAIIVSETGEKIYPILHEKGAIGKLLRGVFGYNGDPGLVEVLSYFTYLGVVGGLWYRYK